MIDPHEHTKLLDSGGRSATRKERQMQGFILNRTEQDNGDHEVHNTSTWCNWMPAPENRIDLGTHMDCRGAVAHAKQLYGRTWRINGCAWCCPACHTS